MEEEEDPPPLTVHLDLHCAAFFPHIVAGCAFVDSSAVLGQIPQCHNLWVFQICRQQQMRTKAAASLIVFALPCVLV